MDLLFVIILILLGGMLELVLTIFYLEHIHPHFRKWYYKFIYKPGKRFFIKYKVIGNNPYKDPSYIDEYLVEIIDTKINPGTKKLWVRFRYLSDKHYDKHRFGNEDKLNTIFEEDSYEFKKLFDNKTHSSIYKTH